MRRAERRTAETDAATKLTVGAVIGSRLLVWVAAMVALALFGRSIIALSVLDPLHLTEPFRSSWGNHLFAPTARWDSVWYLQIAHVGYFSRTSTAFFPLYPSLIHFGGNLFGSRLVVGALISLAAFTVAIYLLYLLARLDLDEAQTRTTVLLVAFFPTAFFFSTVYTEALFLALSIGAIYCARLDRWAFAGLLGALAGVTRPSGLLIAVPLVILYFYGPRAAAGSTVARAWWRPRYRPSRSVLWLALLPVGVIAYLGYLWISHHAPLAPFQAEAAWGRRFAGPFGGVIHLMEALPSDVRRILGGTAVPVGPGDPLNWNAHDLIDLGFLLFTCAGLAFSWRKVPTAYVVYALLTLAMALSYPTRTEPLESFSRYMLVVFPVFMGWGARLGERRALSIGVVAASSALLLVFSGLWGMWAWVA